MNDTKARRSKSVLYIIIGIVFVTSIGFRIIDSHNLEQTALLFIGLPTLIALLIVKYIDGPNSAQGAAFKAVTLFLLIASIAFGEGIICIIMAAPLFYGVTALLVAIYSALQKNDEDDDVLHISLLLPIALLLGQVGDFSEMPFTETVITSKIVTKASLNHLNAEPDFELDLPLFFKSGFPKPLSFEGQGLAIGDSREIKFESSTKGIGSLILEVNEIDDSTIIFGVQSDNSHIAHWLSWQKIEVSVTSLNETESVVTWTSHYTCDLAPHWYFGRMERYAVDLSNEHLIRSFFDVKK